MNNRGLFLDLAFAHVGWIVLDVQNEYVLDNYGCIETTKSPKVRKIRVADDDTRRCREITVEIIRIIHEYDIRIVVLEAPVGSKNARAARCLGMSTGIVAALEAVYDIPFLYVTPTDVKIALCGNKKASKDDMMEKARELFPDFADMPKSKFEHIADALGVAEVVKEDPLIRMLRRV